MATWQFDVNLIPQDSDELPSVDELAARLSRVLEEAESWASDLRIWGTEDGNRVDLWLGGDSVEEVGVRIDVRDGWSEFCGAVLVLAADLGLALREAGTGAGIESTPRGLRSAIASSDAARFVSDPKLFLAELSR